MDAARLLFAEQGHHAVALQEVCDRAGVTRGALYHHFSGKDDLFRAVCEEVAADVSAGVLAVAGAEPDALSRLRAGCLAFLDVCGERDVQQIMLCDAPAVLGWQEFRQIDARHGLGLLKASLSAAVDSGSIPALPVDAVAHLLVAALNEAALLTSRAADPGRARREARVGIERILEGVFEAPLS